MLSFLSIIFALLVLFDMHYTVETGFVTEMNPWIKFFIPRFGVPVAVAIGIGIPSIFLLWLGGFYLASKTFMSFLVGMRVTLAWMELVVLRVKQTP